MRQSPLYNIIHNPDRKSDCSFGSRHGFAQNVRVGTSASNSYTLGRIEVRRHVHEDGTVQFSLYVDGLLIKRGVLNGEEFICAGLEQ